MSDSKRSAGLLDDLTGELGRLQREVRDHPADAKLRTYLFQLLAVQGDWQRALNQLQVAAQLDSGALSMAQTYREAIRCEIFRAEVFAGRRTPHILGEPPPWIGPLVESLGALARGQVAAAELMRAQAFEDAPAKGGMIDQRRFEWVADADPRLGPVLEAILDGKYCWVPFDRLTAVRVEAPTDLRDVVWATAELTFSTEAKQIALIPARYPGTESADKDELKLGRMTTWRELGPETHVGIGQRMWATDAGEFAMLDTREIVMDGAGATPPE